MLSFRLRHVLAPLVAASLIFACGDDDAQPGGETNGGSPSSSEGGAGPGHAGAASGGDGHGNVSAECEVIGTLCHAADDGEGPIADCHALGHDGNAANCKAEFAACISVCVADEGGAGGAGAGGAAATPEPVANPYCQALGELCHFLDDQGTPTGDCHELGHEGREAACIEAFAGCAPLCLAKREQEPGPHGEGGAGHGGAGHTEGGATHTGGAHQTGGADHAEAGAGG
jgi:hypothetical protein